MVGTSRETSRQVIEQFARLHAKWWNSDKLDGYDWGKWIINEMPMEEGLARLRESIRQVEETGSFDSYPEMKRLMYLLPPLFRMQPAPPYPFSLTHGDLRSDNIIQPSAVGGEFCVLDWQLSGKGAASEMAIPRLPGDSGSCARMSRPAFVSDEGLDTTSAPHVSIIDFRYGFCL